MRSKRKSAEQKAAERKRKRMLNGSATKQDDSSLVGDSIKVDKTMKQTADETSKKTMKQTERKTTKRIEQSTGTLREKIRSTLTPDIQKQINTRLQQLSEPDYGKWEVRLVDVLKQKPKRRNVDTKVKITKEKENDDVDISVVDTEETEFTFCPLSQSTKEILKMRTTNKVSSIDMNKECTIDKKVLGIPLESRSIIADGNCFFRALSFAIFSEESHHFRIRSSIVNHLLKNEHVFQSFLRSGYRSISNYVLNRGVLKNGTWATEIEIIAAAHLLQTDIYVFDDSRQCWSKYTGQQADRRLKVECEAIYLKHCYRAHYEVVLSVNEDNNSEIQVGEGNQSRSEGAKKINHQYVCSENSTDDTQHLNNDENLQPVKILQGSCHQGHPQFGRSAGKQCVMNSLASLMFSKIKPTNDWDINDMNLVLNTGNELYQFLTRSSTMHDDYILISEIPRQLECFNKDYFFEFRESLYGLIYHENCLPDSGFLTYTVHDAISRALNNSDGAFVTFKGNTYIIIKETNCFYVFDPHSRDRSGKSSAHGSSLVLQCNTIQELSFHCNALANSLNAGRHEQFEITGVKIIDTCTKQMLPVTSEVDERIGDEIPPQTENTDSISFRQKRKRSQATTSSYRKKKSRKDETVRESKIVQVCKRKAQKRQNEFQNYNTDEMYKQQKLNGLNSKYNINEEFRENVKLKSQSKYETDQQYKGNKIYASKTKYKENEPHRINVKESSKRKYALNDFHRAKTKLASTEKYKTDEIHRARVQQHQ